MAIERFEESIAWQKSKALCIEIYKQFENIKDYGFRDQIQRAAISVMNNIAEGFERKGNKEFSYFLYIAKGSCAEVRSMLILAKELKKISEEEHQTLSSMAEEVSKIISGLIKSITPKLSFPEIG